MEKPLRAPPRKTGDAAGYAGKPDGPTTSRADGSHRELTATGSGGRPEGLRAEMLGVWSIFGQWLSILLVCAPLGLLAKNLKWGSLAEFMLNFLAIIPLAAVLSKATENLAMHVGELFGGLLNATFGNVVEMIITVNAINEGLVDVVQQSLIGSILSNLLLVMGMAFIGSVYKAKDATFNTRGAAANLTCLVLASVALSLPTVYSAVPGAEVEAMLLISRLAAVVMAIIYCLFLYFQLGTHAAVFVQAPATDELEEEAEAAAIRAPTALALLSLTTVTVAACSEVLVGSIGSVTSEYGMPEAFIGVILLPIVGNAAEHTTAVCAAMKGKMDLALGVAVGSATQIALLVVPFSVIVGWCVGVPMSLTFPAFLSCTFVLSVFMTSIVLADGFANWFEGSMLVASYFLIAIFVWYIPESPPNEA